MEEFSASAPASFGPPRWMVSFADLMSVILTFFVLLFSMSSPPQKTDNDENKMRGNSEAAFSVNKNETPTQIKTAITDQDLSTNYLADVVKNRLESSPELSKAKMETRDDQLVVAIASGDFNDDYANNLVQFLKPLKNKVAIYSESLDQSNSVVKKLQEKGFDRNISFFESHNIPGKIDIVIYP